MAAEHLQRLINESEQLSDFERWEFLEHLLRTLRRNTTGPEERYNWTDLRGAAPGMLEGEDAQEWVTRTRRESDEKRERALRGEREQ